jgi:hypothetical protein
MIRFCDLVSTAASGASGGRSVFRDGARKIFRGAELKSLAAAVRGRLMSCRSRLAPQRRRVPGHRAALQEHSRNLSHRRVPRGQHKGRSSQEAEKGNVHKTSNS